MSTPRDRYDAPDGVTVPVRIGRRRALGRLFGLAGAATAAAALPAVAEAQPVSSTLDTPPVTVLPDWLEGQPDWLLVGLERIARIAARPVHPDRSPDRPVAALDCVGDIMEMFADVWTESPDVTEARVAEREREAARKKARTPAEIPTARIATARIAKLDRNRRRRVHRWIKRQPTGPEHPIIRLRPAGRVGEWRRWDCIDVAQPARHRWEETPFAVLDRVMADLGRVIGPRSYVMQCCHWSPDPAYLYALPDGTLVETARD